MRISNLGRRLGRAARALASMAIVAGAATIPVPPASAATFGSGNLVIYRVGDGTVDLAPSGNPVFLDEYTQAGTLVQSIPMPTAASGPNKPLIAGGRSTSEGLLTRSSDGSAVVLAGYGATVGAVPNLATTTAVQVNRVVGKVDGTGAVDTTTALSDFSSGGSPRGVASLNGASFWVAGETGGVRYVSALGNATSTQLNNTSPLRQVGIAGSQLYVSAQSGSLRIGAVGTGLPTTSGQTLTGLSGVSPSSPHAFFFADLDSVPGSETLYVTDDSTASPGIHKFFLTGSTWSPRGIIGAAAPRGLTGALNGATATLFATTGGSGINGGGTLFKFTDTTGAGGTVSGSSTSIATAGLKTAFRGITLAPGSSPVVPEVSLVSLLPLSGAGALALAAFASRRRRTPASD